MPTLHVHGVPDELYERLLARAQAGQRSLRDQVILLLNRALEQEAQRLEQKQNLVDIRRRRFTPPSTAPDVLEMLREDRVR
jgi:hypothetical protein